MNKEVLVGMITVSDENEWWVRTCLRYAYDLFQVNRWMINDNIAIIQRGERTVELQGNTEVWTWISIISNRILRFSNQSGSRLLAKSCHSCRNMSTRSINTLIATSRTHCVIVRPRQTRPRNRSWCGSYFAFYLYSNFDLCSQEFQLSDPARVQLQTRDLPFTR